MSGGHSHSHGESDADVEVGARSRTALTAFLVLVAAATLFGLVRFWPTDAGSAAVRTTDFAAPGVTFPVAEVLRVLPECPDTPSGGSPGAAPAPGQPGDSAAQGTTCGAVTVRLEGSGSAGATPLTVTVPPPVTRSGLVAGDRIQLMRTPGADGQPAGYSFLQVQRGLPLAVMLVLFVAVVAVVARWRGVLALAGLGFGGLVVVKFMLPALLEGSSGLVVAMVGSSAIMFVVLYLAHGLSVRTSTALAGTLFGVVITAVLGVLAVEAARLSGVASDEASTLSSFVPSLQPRELLTCAVIVAGLGVLNDVTITQSSAVWELRGAAPSMGRRELFRSGMRIGRDHIASTIYTIVFAYAGAALPVLLLLFLYERPVLELLQTESLSEEIVRTLASAIGLVLAVPVTTLVAALTVGPAQPATAPRAIDSDAPLPTAADLHRRASGPPPPMTRAEARERARRSR